MDTSIYTIFQLTAAAIAQFIGGVLLFKRMPKELQDTPYERSRRIMGWAIAVLPIITIIYHCTPMTDLPKHYATALCICGFYPSSALASIAILILMGESISFRSKKFRICIITFFAFPVLVAFGIAHLGVNRTIITANTLLFSSIISNIVYFTFKYNEALKRTDTKYFTEIRLHMRWVRKSMIMIGILSIMLCIAPSFLPYHKWFNVVCIIYTLFIFVYIYESYNRFIIVYQLHSVKHPNSNSQSNQRALKMNPELYNAIQKQIGTWISKKKYNKNGITIESVARDICTNRTYLSFYINSIYECSFKTWVTNLRMDEAKKLLADENNYTINYIAHKIGFSSQSSFIHVFRNATGLPPAKWRAQNK